MDPPNLGLRTPDNAVKVHTEPARTIDSPTVQAPRMAQHANPVLARQAATAIARTLRDHGHIAYFAGGCVRDELLGLRPTDYDVATDAPPKRVQSLFRKTASVGASFGVILVADFGPHVEVATFRAEGPYTDKRRPDHITFATPEEDARRRDFTINALFLDPLAAEDSPSINGHIVDLVNGLDDLKAGIIRAVGDPDNRLDEDHLRALRAVRFASRFNFQIEPRTRDAITRHARLLSGVSRERIGDELRKMLTSGRDTDPDAIHQPRPPAASTTPSLLLPPPLAAVRLMESLELDTPALTPPQAEINASGSRTPGMQVLGEPVRSATHPILSGLLDAQRQAELLGNSIPDPLDATITGTDVLTAWALERYPALLPLRLSENKDTNTPPPAVTSPTTAIAALAAGWRDALCLSNQERDRLIGVLTILHRLNAAPHESDEPHAWTSRSVAERKRLAAQQAFLPALRLLHAASPAEQFAHKNRQTVPAMILANVRELANDGVGIAPNPVLTGDDLIRNGHKAGPRFKAILAAVYDEQLEGRVRTIEQGLAFVARRGRI